MYDKAYKIWERYRPLAQLECWDLYVRGDDHSLQIEKFAESHVFDEHDAEAQNFVAAAAANDSPLHLLALFLAGRPAEQYVWIPPVLRLRVPENPLPESHAEAMCSVDTLPGA